MKVTLAELLDRWTIELRKEYYGHGNPDLISEVHHEILAHFCSSEHTIEQVVTCLLATAKLGIVNADIASCEWQIRAGRNLSLEDLGQRAVITRKLNDYRSEIKHCLSAALGQNAETRHYGFGGTLDPDKMSMEVQEPAAKS